MAVLVFYIGAIFGSFFLVIGTRLPKKEDVIFTRSKCDNCGYTLKWYNLFPIFSYIFQRGKCMKCKKNISSEHLWVELITGLLFVLTYYYFPIGYNFFVGLIVASLIVVIFISDFKYMIILDSSLIVSGVLVLVLKFIYLGLDSTIYSLISGIALFCVMLLIEKIGTFVLKKESLGGGDIKLSFIIGLCLNFKLGMIALVLSTFLALPYALASVYIKKNHEFPYGPFLAGALFIVFFHYDKFEMFTSYFLPFL